MRFKAPRWWYHQNSLISGLFIPFVLSPFSLVYGMGNTLRWAVTKPYQSRLPVICIGNFTMGGAGKTPMALFLADALIAQGKRPVFLTRGYGGRITGPHLVSQQDTADDVGDEPLLLAQKAPCVVCADRSKGAAFIEQLRRAKPSVILMDDGFQNPTLHKDLNIVVIDAQTALGNRAVFPAGPLRAPLPFQERKADIIVLVHQAGSDHFDYKTELPLYNAFLKSRPEHDSLNGQRVIAYCGIAHPQKFYTTLQELGAEIVATYDFPDHYNFQNNDAERLLQEAKTHKAQLVTTDKDFIRLPDDDDIFSALKRKSQAVGVYLSFSEDDQKLLLKKIKAIISR